MQALATCVPERLMHRRLAGLSLIILTAIGVLATPGALLPARAVTTRTWVGPNNGTWSTAANWSPAGAPQNGDALVFPSPAATAKSSVNNLVELTVDSIQFDTYTSISGNRLNVKSEIRQSAVADDFLDLPIVLKDDIVVSIAAPTGRIFMRNRLQPLGTLAIDLGGHTLHKTGFGDMEINGDVIGGGKLAYEGGQSAVVVPLTFAGQVSIATGAELVIGELGGGMGYCGTAPNIDVTLTGGVLTATCDVFVNSVTGSGRLDVFSDGDSLSVAGKEGTRFDGNITGLANTTVTCCTKGPWVLGGTSTFAGFFNVVGNRLTLAGGSLANATLQFDSGATVAGYGTFGPTVITEGRAEFEPVDGVLAVASFPNLTMHPTVTAAFTIHGALPGVGFAQVLMTGLLDINGAALELKFDDYAPPTGQAYTLFRGGPTLTGTFKGLAEGANFTAGGYKFKITYKGGTGHDVVITSQGGAATPTPTATPSPTPTSIPGGLGNRRVIPQVAKD
jgi:hypothetical protein